MTELSFTRSKPFSLPREMQPYLAARNTAPGPHLQSLIEIADTMPEGRMRLGTEAGTFLTILTQAVQPTFVVEVGTFIGYSSLCIAAALPADGRLLCCDTSDEWTRIARDHWEAAGVSDQIELVVGPAAETLAGLDADQHVDLAFIDADKTGYTGYYEELVPRLSARGVLAVDNVMWGGAVLDVDDQSDDTVALRAFNDHVAADPRTRNVIVPIGDGVMLVSLA